jgi:hypothetical protein
MSSQPARPVRAWSASALARGPLSPSGHHSNRITVSPRSA